MNNKKLIYAGGAVILALLWAIAFLLGVNSKEPVIEEDTATPQISMVDKVKAVVVPSEDRLEDIITVSDPFGNAESVGMSMATSTNAPFSNLVATMEFTSGQSTVTQLDGNFNNTVMSNTAISSEEPMSIVHKMRYDADSVLVWTPAEGDNFTWNKEPSRESIPFGSVATITYSTKDASGQWTGDIQIDKPNT